jgi:hypothetical protein
MYIQLLLDAIDIHHIEERLDLGAPLRHSLSEIHILEGEPGLSGQEFEELHFLHREGLWLTTMPEQQRS